MNTANIIFFFLFSTTLCQVFGKQNIKSSIDEVSDIKDFKKILRTKNNVLVCFISSLKEASNILKIFKEAADVIKGQGTMVQIDCSGEAKKLCKKLKVTPEPYVLRHYKDGDFHKIYDRRESVASMVNFMRDPTGDIPWEEDDKTVDIVHLPDPSSLLRLVKKDTRPILVMFYAPWCGFCKILKPEFSEAASALKGTHVLAAIDVNRPENIGIRVKYNITGFPTLLYFQDGEIKYTYEGENKKDDIIRFMKDPTAVPIKPKNLEKDWSEENNEVMHLTSETFNDYTKADESTLVMFYAPWCGHCKKMKPEYEKAAAQMKLEKIKGSLAAVDATKDAQLAKRFNVKGYPTIKYFRFGEFIWDTPQLRESNAILNFMKDPKEPPAPPAPEPSWEDQPSEVVHLNTENFKNFLKKKKHVLVMYYAPWCGHCKMAKPEFQQAAEEMKDDIKTAFAALDCTKYSSVCQAVGVSGYPTIKYYNYYNKEPAQDYTGGRKKSDFISFMKKKSEASKFQGSVKTKEEL